MARRRSKSYLLDTAAVQYVLLVGCPLLFVSFVRHGMIIKTRPGVFTTLDDPWVYIRPMSSFSSTPAIPTLVHTRTAIFGGISLLTHISLTFMPEFMCHKHTFLHIFTHIYNLCTQEAMVWEKLQQSHAFSLVGKWYL